METFSLHTSKLKIFLRTFPTIFSNFMYPQWTFVWGRESQAISPKNIKLTVNWRGIYTECVFSSLWNWWRWFIVITFFSFWWIRKIWFIITFCVWVVRAYFENIILNALILKTIKGMIVCMANILIFNDITKFNGFRVKTTFFYI